MIYNKFGEGLNFVPLLAPQDIAATATATPFVSLKGALEGTFYVFFGSITAASADQSITVTVEAATAAASGSEAAVAFSYRLSGAVGANTLGAITAATTAGVSVATTDDNKALLININPAALANALADASHARVVITPNAGGTATLVSAWAEITQGYSKNTMLSAT